jgi:RHS repeat-associated protein
VKAWDNVDNDTGWVQSGPVYVGASVKKYYTFNGQRVAMRQGDEVYYFTGDHLGSVSLTTDSAGQIVSEVRHLPYGQERWSRGAGVTDFGFISQRNEAGFGLMDYQARYYSPYLGRFASPDTIIPDPANPQSFNRYAYGYNNPLRYTDPSGHLSEDQLKQVLGDNYDSMMGLWKEKDPYFYDVITGDELQSGDFLEASMLEGQLFFLEMDGVMSVHCPRWCFFDESVGLARTRSV